MTKRVIVIKPVKGKFKRALDIPNKIVDKTMTAVAAPIIMTVGVRKLKKKTGVSTNVARREMREAIKRRLKR